MSKKEILLLDSSSQVNWILGWRKYMSVFASDICFLASLYFRKTLHLKSCSEYSWIVNMPGFWTFRVTQGFLIFVNMTGFWIYPRIQLWKGFEYCRIPNMPGLFMCNRYTRFWIWLNNAWINCSDYGRVLNKPCQSFTGFWINMTLFVNMPGFGIWRSCKYMTVTQGTEYAWISLNMP